MLINGSLCRERFSAGGAYLPTLVSLTRLLGWFWDWLEATPTPRAGTNMEMFGCAQPQVGLK